MGEQKMTTDEKLNAKKKSWTEYSKEELLSLPTRDWSEISSYDAVLFVNTKKKHSSGYNLFAIIGCEGEYPIEICGYMDDFRFNCCYKNDNCFDEIKLSDIAFDCSMRGVFRMHSRRKIFVGDNTSTTSWWLDGERR